MHILFIGAHPDDCELCGGGTAALLAQQGAHVKFVSVTNGDSGHMEDRYRRDRNALALRRMAEAQRSVAVCGAQFECLNCHDGDVYVTPELTRQMIRAIRSAGPTGHGPDLVIVNRPCDYHRDHRYTAQLVLDATYMLTVPLMCPDTPHLERMPVFAYWFDQFKENGVFRPDVVVPVDGVMGDKIDMVYAHDSQMLEWIPYNRGVLAQVPPDEPGRRAYVRTFVEGMSRDVADSCRRLAPRLLPAACQFAEAFQISEYGRQPDPLELPKLFPGQRPLDP